jgi:hypothetical protein
LQLRITITTGYEPQPPLAHTHIIIIQYPVTSSIMSDTSIKVNMTTLTRNNWLQWMTGTKAVLDARDLWEVVNDGDSNKYKSMIAEAGNDTTKVRSLEKKNSEAIALIYTNVHESLTMLIMFKKSASEM